MYDFLVVGSGLFGSVFAREMVRKGRTVLILEKRSVPGGNVSTEKVHGISVHVHGPHIFHTSCNKLWEYVNGITEFSPYKHKVKANCKGKIYSLPFNLQTFYEMWGCSTPKESLEELERQKVPIAHPSNLEEWALANIGPDLYHTLVYGYTKKQWMRDPKSLPVSIIHRLPVRLTYDDNYYNHLYQGIPVKGYSHFVQQIIDGIEIKYDADFFDLQDWRKHARKLVYSGPIDQFFNYEFGQLEYRGLHFERKIVSGSFQGIAQMNYTHENIPYTRIVEHGHFDPSWDPGLDGTSLISYEYPIEWEPGKYQYYPVNDQKNNLLYQRYKSKIKEQEDVIVGGRLGSFRYTDMDMAIAQALTAVNRELIPLDRVLIEA